MKLKDLRRLLLPLGAGVTMSLFPLTAGNETYFSLGKSTKALFRLGPLISGSAPVTYHPEAIDAWNRAGSNGPAVYLEAMSDLAYFYETNNLRGKVWRLDVFPGTSIVSMAATLFYGTNAAHVHGFTNLLNVGLAAGNCFPSNGLQTAASSTYFDTGASISNDVLGLTGHMIASANAPTNYSATVAILCGPGFTDITARRALMFSVNSMFSYGGASPAMTATTKSNLFFGYLGSKYIANETVGTLAHASSANPTSVRIGAISNRTYFSSPLFIQFVQIGSYMTTDEAKLCRQALSNFNVRVGRPAL